MKDLNFYVFISKEILEMKKLPKIVVHDFEGDWQILDSWELDEDQMKVISMEEAISLDDTINEILDLPIGVYAEKGNNSEVWEFYKLEE